MQRSTKDQEIPSDGNFLDEPIRRNKNPRRTDKTCSPGISDRFRLFPLVGQGVSLNPEPLAFGYKESPQTSRLRGFFGASDVTRTRDLLITKGTKPLQMMLNRHLWPFSLTVCLLFGTPCPTDSIGRFLRMGQGVGLKTLKGALILGTSSCYDIDNSSVAGK